MTPALVANWTRVDNCQSTVMRDVTWPVTAAGGVATEPCPNNADGQTLSLFSNVTLTKCMLTRQRARTSANKQDRKEVQKIKQCSNKIAFGPQLGRKFI